MSPNCSPQIALCNSGPAYLALAGSVQLRQKQYVDFVVYSDIINSQEVARKLYIGSREFISKLQEYYQIKNRREARGRPPKEENYNRPLYSEPSPLHLCYRPSFKRSLKRFGYEQKKIAGLILESTRSF